MKSLLFCALSATSLLACAVEADTSDTEQASTGELNNIHKSLPHGFARPGGGGSTNLSYHNGPTIQQAHVVPIFWGPSWTGADAGLQASITSYIAAFGNSGEYNVITQYSSTQTGHIQLTNLAGGDGAYNDTSAPPTNVTDAALQAEVNAYLTTHTFDPNAIYEVFLPSTSYSSDGTSTSCGGPKLAYCAYHGNFAGANGDTKYASMPYPGCGGCQSAGFTVAQNFEHFISHETREAVTDPDLNAWYDRQGNEADDKCAWSPTPFIDSATGFAYQYEWSNANGACVKTR